MALPVVTPENYYSPEMNMAYMGSTQFKAFERCEAGHPYRHDRRRAL